MPPRPYLSVCLRLREELSGTKESNQYKPQIKMKAAWGGHFLPCVSDSPHPVHRVPVSSRLLSVFKLCSAQCDNLLIFLQVGKV